MCRGNEDFDLLPVRKKAAGMFIWKGKQFKDSSSLDKDEFHLESENFYHKMV